MTLGELLVKARRDELRCGNIPGRCVVCSQLTEYGLRCKDVFSGNFTGWNKLFAGDCVCPECAYLFSDQVFRKQNWVASIAEGFKVLERNRVLAVLFEPPEPPFFIYVRKAMGGQRQGWLSCIHRVAGNRQQYYFAHEAYDVPVWWDRNVANMYREQVAAGFAAGLTKRDLLHGPSVYGWKKAHEAGRADLVRELRRNLGNPLWEVIVDVYPAEKSADGRAGEESDRAAGSDLQPGEVAEDTEQKSA